MAKKPSSMGRKKIKIAKIEVGSSSGKQLTGADVVNKARTLSGSSDRNILFRGLGLRMARSGIASFVVVGGYLFAIDKLLS
ncbi:hypothetical protein T459_29513 [Capsicum annuum]|uniref:Uncharacterized protein n=1 Tax=Capsicum annuum TaxID=4072 RepID=A0A2G2Y5U1_CAPAN|nr:hypothetical protein T459_29513 [Capsicum annuum]